MAPYANTFLYFYYNFHGFSYLILFEFEFLLTIWEHFCSIWSIICKAITIMNFIDFQLSLPNKIYFYVKAITRIPAPNEITSNKATVALQNLIIIIILYLFHQIKEIYQNDGYIKRNYSRKFPDRLWCYHHL